MLDIASVSGVCVCWHKDNLVCRSGNMVVAACGCSNHVVNGDKVGVQ